MRRGREFSPDAKRVRGGAVFKALVFLAAVFAVGALAWMLFLPALFVAQLRERTGFGVELRSLVANPFTGTIELRGLRLANPAAFPGRDFLQLREFRLRAEVATMFSGRPVFEEVVIDIAQLTLVKAADGRTNTGAFQRGFAVPAADRKAPRFLIRRLTLRLDRLIVADHSGPGPVVRESDPGINCTLTNVTDLQPLLPVEVWESLAPVGAALGGLMPGDLGAAWRAAAKDAARAGAAGLREAGLKAGEKAKGFLEALEESKKP